MIADYHFKRMLDSHEILGSLLISMHLHRKITTKLGISGKTGLRKDVCQISSDTFRADFSSTNNDVEAKEVFNDTTFWKKHSF